MALFSHGGRAAGFVKKQLCASGVCLQSASISVHGTPLLESHDVQVTHRSRAGCYGCNPQRALSAEFCTSVWLRRLPSRCHLQEMGNVLVSAGRDLYFQADKMGMEMNVTPIWQYIYLNGPKSIFDG